MQNGNSVGYPTRGALLITNQAWLRAHCSTLATAGAPLSPQAEVTPPSLQRQLPATKGTCGPARLLNSVTNTAILLYPKLFRLPSVSRTSTTVFILLALLYCIGPWN
jgi:hypothetical protein